MRYSYKFSDAIHLLAYLVVHEGGDCSSKAIAASIEVNPSVVRKLMADLRHAKIIDTQTGKARPSLTRPAKEITLFAVFCAIQMDHELLHVDPATNPQEKVGQRIQPVLNHYYARIQDAATAEMQRITIADIVQQINQK